MSNAPRLARRRTESRVVGESEPSTQAPDALGVIDRTPIMGEAPSALNPT
jgi:hypothetical protein